MSTNSVLHARTAMPEDAKIRSLANDLTRRMLTTSERIDDAIRRGIVDDFAKKLLNSVYIIPVTRKIILAGIKGYEKKLKNSKRLGGRKLLRTAEESHDSSIQKKLLDRTEWFKEGTKRARDEEELSDEEKVTEFDNAPDGRKPPGFTNTPDDWKPQHARPEGWKARPKRKRNFKELLPEK